MIASATVGHCDHFVSVGGVPAYRGWTNAQLFEPAGTAGADRRGQRARGRSRARRQGLPHRPHGTGRVRRASERRALPLSVSLRPVSARAARVGDRPAHPRRPAPHHRRRQRADAAPSLLHRELRGRGRRGGRATRAQRGDDLQHRRRRSAHGAPGRRAVRARARRGDRDRVDALRARGPRVAVARAAVGRPTGCST